jgi:cobalt-zinc-cadmium efflux system outer membrane protein
MLCPIVRATRSSSVNRRASSMAKLAFGSLSFLVCELTLADQGNILTLAEAVSLASGDQPQLAALALQEQAARESARAETQLPDPKLVFGFQNVPVSGSDAFRLDRDDMTMVGIGVMQDVVTRSKRNAASARMSAEADRVVAERMLSTRTIQRDVALVWVDAFEAQRRAATMRKQLAEMTAERQVGTATLSSGGSEVSEVLRLDGELSMARDQLILAERDEARARASLLRWIGEDAVRPLPDALPHELSSAVNRVGALDLLGSHPALQTAQRAVDVALREVERARADRAPDWGWQLMYGQRQDDRSDMVSIQLTVGLPLNRAAQQDRRIAEKLAEASAMRSEAADRQRMLEAELATINADLRADAQRLREHEEHRIPSARARLDSAQAAYAGGAGSLAEVWQARRAWIDAGLHHEMIIAERARSLARLSWLTGELEVLP